MSTNGTEGVPRQPRHPPAAAPQAGDDQAAAAYSACLADLARLLDVDPGPGDPGTREWRSATRAAIWRVIRKREDLPDLLFEAVVRAGVHTPDPSHCLHFIIPAVNSYGHRRVMTALLGYLRHGTNPERAGAARAWYGTGASQSWIEEHRAEWDGLADLAEAFREALLREFVSNEDRRVRFYAVRMLSLKAERYPEHLRPLVKEAIRIGRAHPDERIRQLVEGKVRAL